ncbi:sigma-54-dependent Fis family transcriptional regulator [Bacillus sp. FJAT-50079]|uniref:sigma-54-dependent Fis family transcriptional regulator n=1 Tax=Bacillus sp. FJAT-50079 TaxID=2833577 RepID=UPI001BC8F218|nr:sigma-54-dependent Fis family transcriptional regulator [Bacillus sp. FJAT-50079]MBS4210458.1 sigma-54-dependent Fis family transcriptional regulator [Bacillus sp. FJAT-50079]
MKYPFVPLGASSSPGRERVKIEKAWEQFVSGENSPSTVRSLTYQSWERSLKHGVHPLHGRAPIRLSEDKVQEYQSINPFYSTKESLLIRLKESTVDSGYLLTFCNPYGEILSIDGDPSLKEKAEEMNFIVGSSWSEQHVGTNGMGTSLAIGSPFQVFASEHFCQPVHNWVCSASPIKDPATKKILGAINITGIWDGVHPHSLSAVLFMAQTIEQHLLNKLKLEHFLLLEHFSERIRKGRGDIIAVLDRGHKVIKASSLFYENDWVNEKNQLVILNDTALAVEQPYKWKSEERSGDWVFESIPFYVQKSLIGFIVYAISPIKSLTNRTRNVTKYSFSSMIGRSKEFLSMIEEARLIANLDLVVMIAGESGTGKELLAQSIHSASARSSNPFVAVNCGAIPKELAASELFGYEEGSFTGSLKGGQPGKFEQAQGGTIFLDEIGELPLDLQVLLLRALEEKEIVRLGGRQPIKLNVRVITATNRDLIEACEAGKFRKDLYYRLNILSLHVPPLRRRTGDIPIILDHLLKKSCAELGRPQIKVDKPVLAVLEKYSWPGNVRELRNLAYKMVIRAKENLFTLADLPDEWFENRTMNEQASLPHHSKIWKTEQVAESLPLYQDSISKMPSLKQQELDTILAVLNESEGNVSKAAKKLGIHRSTIYRKLGSLAKNDDN